MTLFNVGRETDFSKGFLKLVEAGGKQVVIADVNGKLYAFDDKCTHYGGHLSRGLLMDNIVQCPLHGSQFDITTGDRKAGPAVKPIKIYSVNIVNGDVFIDIA